MGQKIHHAILVTAHSLSDAYRVVEQARQIGLCVTEPALAGDGVITIMVAPDGVSEGREESNGFDARRAGFKAWLGVQAHFDGSCLYSWVEVAYGEVDAPSILDGDHLHNPSE